MSTTLPGSSALSPSSVSTLAGVGPVALSVFPGSLAISVPLGALAVELGTRQGVSALIVGAVIGLQSIATLLTRHRSGTLADHHGPHRAILLGLPISAVSGLAYLLLPLIRPSTAGRILNVSSGIGSLTLNSEPSFPFRPYFGATCPASKTALDANTLALAVELDESGIKVRAASPGFTATAINDFQGTDSVEVGARPLVLAALDADSPTGSFTGPDGPLPW
ncbi:MAG: SDR family NAD(P)-dependent oxidoreductase [Rhodobacteraceae bacterium]|nr:SDR family NAD(P)-dependent oxidoreductase [Paracoccaceae bacterium]MBR9819751.1 SDR family NAD(P)-dependent oxidoreductase [Paracoccaceae bacterium]